MATSRGLRTTLEAAWAWRVFEELGIFDDVESGVVKHQNEELEAPWYGNGDEDAGDA